MGNSIVFKSTKTNATDAETADLATAWRVLNVQCGAWAMLTAIPGVGLLFIVPFCLAGMLSGYIAGTFLTMLAFSAIVGAALAGSNIGVFLMLADGADISGPDGWIFLIVLLAYYYLHYRAVKFLFSRL